MGAFRVVSSRDLRDHNDRAADPRSGDLRHLREERLIETVRVPGHRVVEGGDPTSPDGIQPIWIQHDATALAKLDSRVRPAEVGAIAAFARAAFVPGRWICLYSDYPPDYERRVQRGIRRWARIESDFNTVNKE